MSNAASGLAHLKPFLPGLEPLLEDAEVSEIMINGPGNVWIEAKRPVNGSCSARVGRIGLVTGGYSHRPSFGPGPGHHAHHRRPAR